MFQANGASVFSTTSSTKWKKPSNSELRVTGFKNGKQVKCTIKPKALDAGCTALGCIVKGKWVTCSLRGQKPQQQAKPLEQEVAVLRVNRGATWLNVYLDARNKSHENCAGRCCNRKRKARSQEPTCKKNYFATLNNLKDAGQRKAVESLCRRRESWCRRANCATDAKTHEHAAANLRCDREVLRCQERSGKDGKKGLTRCQSIGKSCRCRAACRIKFAAKGKKGSLEQCFRKCR